MLRIALTGPESTGKTTLAEQLAQHYNTAWVPERARTYLAELGKPYQEKDLLQIARQQMAQEDELARQAKGLLFCDTDLLVMKIWSQVKYGRVNEWILEELEKKRYDHYLLLYPDLPWTPDPQREHPHLREQMFRLYQGELKKLKRPYTIIQGEGEDRLQAAIRAIDRIVAS
ncbi:NAD metabolism ATPase/kinase-like protein [Flammeovirgaceae bacterium 311]|nr:NAD metabolism ATPase/kinase-like protein [Flammeovirgaceae bacterium 311]